MGFDVSSIFEGGVAGIFKGVKDVVSAFKADPTVALQSQQKLAELDIAMQQAELQAEVSLAQAQMQINQTEAASSDKFSSRWRPAAGWLGVLGLAYSVIVYPLLTWGSVNFGWKTPPPLDTNVLETLLFAMLGIGGMRSFDKLKGTSK